MVILPKIKSHSDYNKPHYNKSQYDKPIEKPKLKRLKNIDQLAELSFYEQLRVIKTN